MQMTKTKKTRLDRLQHHLQSENEDLMSALDTYRELDQVAHKMGLLDPAESYAHNISWWPLVSVLGTFSAGKSSFINSYLGLNLQRTGNQAVDDHFTVITYGTDEKVKTLPGQALDSDPRFPFYRISDAIEQVAPGEGRRIDRYLQMKVAPSDALKGKIIIDSPGFDADAQRSSTLKITNHIIGLSDLVLVFFDARHPEVGAMKDTLQYLVRGAVDSIDSEKFVFILNQIDTSAKENNLEDIVAAWRSSLAQHGLNAGKFYISFNKDAALPVEDKTVWSAYETKRDADFEQIQEQLDNVNTFRTYRIVGRIKLLVNAIEEKAAPALSAAYSTWRKLVLLADAVLLAVAGGVAFALRDTIMSLPTWQMAAVGVGAFVALAGIHIGIRKVFSSILANRLKDEEFGHLGSAFKKSTSTWRPLLLGNVKGWGGRTRRRLEHIRDSAEQLIENLNNRNADPSGRTKTAAIAELQPLKSIANHTADKPEAASKQAAKGA